MKFHLLYVSSVSACFELENTSPYYAEDAFDVTVNGAPALQGVRTNVFSLFELQPGTEYTVAIGQDELTFSTKTETGCVNVRDFGAVGDGETDDTDAICLCVSTQFCPLLEKQELNIGEQFDVFLAQLCIFCQSSRFAHADVFIPFGPCLHAKVALDCHVHGVVGQPAAVFTHELRTRRLVKSFRITCAHFIIANL